jgi:hypothetical protein
MDAKKEAIIAKIMKLMELGNEEKNSNPHERESATKMAAKLMADYAIDFIDLKNNKIKDTEPFITIKVDGSSEQKVDYEASLAFAIAKAFDCKMINEIGFDRAWRIIFIGSKHDLDIAVYFFKFLRRTLYAMSSKNVTKESLKEANPYLGRRITEKYIENARRNYCFGLVQTISQRLDDLYIKKEEFIPSDCKDLVLVRKDDLAKFVKDQFPSLRHVRVAGLTGDMSAYHKGVVDGKNVNLSRPLPNSSTPATQLGG